MSMSIRALLFTAIAGLMATGCATAGKYSCPVPGGTGCMSTREVYQATNDVDTLEVKSASGKTAGSRRHAGRDSHTEYGAPNASSVGAVIEDDSLRLVAVEVEVEPQDSYVPQIEPMRTPAKVMRIWITPFQDGAGDLHMPGYVMTEIESKRWAVAVTPPVEAPDMHLVTPPEPAATANAPATPAAPTSIATN